MIEIKMATAVFASVVFAQVWGGNWKAPFGTQAYGPPAQAQAVAFPQVVDPTSELGPFTCAGVTPTDGTHACEGKIACRMTAGIRCIEGASP
jgi:hypothetical protein